MILTTKSYAFITVNEADRAITIKRIKASHFLHQATFGPNIEEINALADRMQAIGDNQAFEEWIDQQFRISPSFHERLTRQLISNDGLRIDAPRRNGGRINIYKDFAWWNQAVYAPDQLRQRMAWALMQILVISDANLMNTRNDFWLGAVDYYDMLLDNSFRSYRKILFDVTMHPVMGEYLSHVKNRKANPSIGRFPDENFAREILQLFGTGIFRLDLGGNQIVDSNGNAVEIYDNETIRNFARVFTGLSYAPRSGPGNFIRNRRNTSTPMVMYDRFHDSDPKVLLRGRRLPGGRTGMDDINAAIGNIFWDPNCPPFIARLLIQRFTTSNPSTDYIRAVAEKFIDNGSGRRGRMTAVIREILMHPEARQSLNITEINRGNGRWAIAVAGKDNQHSKMREPILMLTSILRAFRASPTTSDGFFRLSTPSSNIAQRPYGAPSVFNYYLPDFQPVGPVLNENLVAPEFQIYTPLTANNISNHIRNMIFRRQARPPNNQGTLNLTPEQNIAGNPYRLINKLDLMLCYGTLSRNVRFSIAEATKLSNDNRLRVNAALSVLLTTPDFAIME